MREELIASVQDNGEDASDDAEPERNGDNAHGRFRVLRVNPLTRYIFVYMYMYLCMCMYMYTHI